MVPGDRGAKADREPERLRSQHKREAEKTGARTASADDRHGASRDTGARTGPTPNGDGARQKLPRGDIQSQDRGDVGQTCRDRDSAGTDDEVAVI